MDTLRKQMAEQPRTSEGGFWHKLRYPHQMWLDGIFMASPYLVQYGSTFQEPALYDEAVKQILLIARKTYDPTTGLYYHGWDESREQKWANPETGCSPNFWSRSIGWYGAALVDVLDYLPQETTGRDSVMQILQGLAKTLMKYQDPQSGTWYQVTDQGAREGNYLNLRQPPYLSIHLPKLSIRDISARITSNLPAKLLMEWSRHLPVLKKTVAIPLRIVVR